MKEVTFIQTNDGKLHKSESKAKAHLLNEMQTILGETLKGMLKTENNNLTATDIYKIVLFLTPDYNKAVSFIAKLALLIESKPDGGEHDLYKRIL